MKHDVEQHVKFKMLQRKLGFKLWQTKGVLESLWGFCATNTMRGDIGRFSNEEICACIEWEDDPQKLFDALVDCSWLDPCAEHRLIVHDWEHHCPNFIKGNLKKHGKAFAQRVAKQPAKHGAKRGADPLSQAATKPNPTKPNQNYSASGDTVGTSLKSKKGRKLQGNILEWFNLFWEAFSHKKGKAEAMDAWLDIEGLNKDLADEITAAAKIEALNRKSLIEAKRTPIMAQGWLTGRRWEDEVISATPGDATGGNSKIVGV
ncbi:hypothetical protein P4C99_20125 [Pontiellaceae bacterium B1224]|nr:hypothetical protein [Pontiellaceae bacterium B1224]